MLERIRNTFQGARKLESIILIIVIALAGLCLFGEGGINGGGNETELESRMTAILSHIHGAEDSRVMITATEDGAINGAVVVTKAASDIRTCISIQKAVRTLLDIDLSRIEIISR